MGLLKTSVPLAAITVTIVWSLVVLQSVSCEGPLLAYETVFNWKEIDFEFDPPSLRDEYIKSGKFIRDNNVITGVKVSSNRVYLTVPRWRKGVPATLVQLPYDPSSPVPANREVTNGPKLIPYPSWKMNEIGNCSAFQYVQSMEIDQFGRMWVVDVGRVFSNDSTNNCSPKLVLIDLNTNEVISTHEFPADVVSRNSSFLNDIVVGCTSKEECWAYITDASDAKIVVYNLQKNKSWFAKHSSMISNPDAQIIPIQGENYTFDTNVDGIALSPLDSNFDTLYYSPLSSYDLYSVPTEILKKNDGANGAELGDSVVKHVGNKTSQTDGMTIDASGLLYFGLLATSAVNTWNTSNSRLTEYNQPELVQNDIDLQWPDTLAIDDKGFVFVTTNRLQRFSTDTYDWESINFRVIRFFIGTKSYMHSKSDMISPTPDSEPLALALAEPEPEAEAEPTGTASPEPTIAMDMGVEIETTVIPSAAEPEPEVEPEAEAEPTATTTATNSKDEAIKPSDKHKYEVHRSTNQSDIQTNSIPGQSQSQVHSGASTFVFNCLISVVIPVTLFAATLV